MAINKSSGSITKSRMIRSKDYPTKQVINFVMDDRRADNRKAFLCFMVFMVVLAVFIFVGVISPLNNVIKTQNNYNFLKSQYDEYAAIADKYSSIQSDYNQNMNLYMTDEELECINRPDILATLSDDIVPYVDISKIEIESNTIILDAKASDVATLNKVLGILREDSRISYATITAISESTEDETEDSTKVFSANYMLNWGVETAEEVNEDAES